MDDADGAAVQRVAESYALEDRLRRTEEKLAMAQAAAQIGSWEYDLRTCAITCTAELYRLIGTVPQPHGLGVAALWKLVHPEDREALSVALDVARERRDAFSVDTRIVQPGGEERWFEHRGHFRFDGELPIGVVGTAFDITARKRAEAHLIHASHYDALTGLPNRKLLVDRLQQALAANQRAGTMLAVMVVDLDRFKIINDTLGHAAGDALLRAAVPRLSQPLRAIDTVARVGGDEFVIVLPALHSPEDVARIARELNAGLHEPFVIENRELYTTASIGISVFPADGETVDQLLRNADAAMYRAKESGRNAFCFYAPSIHARAVDRLVLENQLRRALDNGEFLLHYQPIVDAHDRVVSIEALLRWNHPLLGTIRPDAFIPLCEEIGLIVPIGRWVMRTAVAQVAAWRASGIARHRLAINVSSRQMQGNLLPQLVLETLRDFDFPAVDLDLEITESAVMGDIGTAGAALAEVKSMGVQVSLDDFGTGYSSLSYLKHFRVDTIKIDRTFVRDLPHDRGDVAIVSAVVALAEALGVRVVAEGVETPAQAELVRRLGCHELQGYYFWRPLSAADMETVLRAQRRPGVEAPSA